MEPLRPMRAVSSDPVRPTPLLRRIESVLITVIGVALAAYITLSGATLGTKLGVSLGAWVVVLLLACAVRKRVTRDHREHVGREDQEQGDRPPPPAPTGD